MQEGELLPTVLKAEKKQSWGTLLGRSLLVLLAIALVAVGISWAFGWAAFEKYSAADLYAKILNGRNEVRSMAAAEWSRELLNAEQAGDLSELNLLRPDAAQTKVLMAELRAQNVAGVVKDPVLAGGLATLLSFSSQSEEVREGLVQFVEGLGEGQATEAYIYSILALARLGSPNAQSLALFLKASENADSSVRKSAAFALGNATGELALDPSALAQLKNLLQDSAEDVRWNAAFALARHKDSSGLQVIAQLLSELQADNDAARNPALNRFPVYLEAFRATRSLNDAGLSAQLAQIAHAHPNLKIRQAAKLWVSK